MTRNSLMIDLAIAVMCALVVLIVSPGLAVDAIVALIVLAGCAVSYAVGRRRGGKGSVPGFGADQGVIRRSRRPRP